MSTPTAGRWISDVCAALLRAFAQALEKPERVDEFERLIQDGLAG